MVAIPRPANQSNLYHNDSTRQEVTNQDDDDGSRFETSHVETTSYALQTGVGGIDKLTDGTLTSIKQKSQNKNVMLICRNPSVQNPSVFDPLQTGN